MLLIAGKTAGPNGQNFVVECKGGRGCFRLNKIEFFFSNFFFHGQRRALKLVTHSIQIYKSDKSVH